MHGGVMGFHTKIWDVVEVSPSEITLHYQAGDGEEGFSGMVDVWVTYTITAEKRTKDEMKQLRHAATLEADGRSMECWTTMPGLQVYTGNYVEPNIGKSGRRYDKQHAICLEAQYWPDSIHHSEFPSIVLHSNERLEEVTEYRFSLV